MERHLGAACSVGKWPRALTARRGRASRPSRALVVQTTVPLSRSKRKNGTNFSPGVPPRRTSAGWRGPPARERGEPVERLGLGCGGGDRFGGGRERRPGT